MPTPIRPSRVRYIKLGREGSWEQECLKKGIIRLGFGTAKEQRFSLATTRKWKELKRAFLAAGKDKGTATRSTNEVKVFFEDDGSTLWITFIGEELCWGSLASGPAERHPDGDGVFRKVVGGWKRTDLLNEPLTKDRLSGSLTQLSAYRGTSCGVGVADYVIRRVNGQKIPQVERAVAAMAEMREATRAMMQLLTPKDFETLVDLVFTTTGWRRQGVVGTTTKTKDLDLILPSTNERAFVQVKSKTTQAELEDYIGRFEELAVFDKMFFVYHSGKDVATDDERVFVIGPEKLAEMVMDAGLATWLLRKVA